MDRKNFADVFLSSTMGRLHYDSYRCAITNLIENEYPYLRIVRFEDTSNSDYFRDWELKKIRDSALLIGLIFTDSDEVIREIQMAIDFQNPVFLLFFPDKKKSTRTWELFAIDKGIKVSVAKNWEILEKKLKDSIEEYMIDLLNAQKTTKLYRKKETLEKI